MAGVAANEVYSSRARGDEEFGSEGSVDIALVLIRTKHLEQPL